MTAKEFWNTQISTDANKCYVSDFYAKTFNHGDLFRFAEAYAKSETIELLKQHDELLEALKGACIFITRCPLLKHEEDRPRGLEKWQELITKTE